MHPTMVVSINIGVHKIFFIEIEWIECCLIILSFQGSKKKKNKGNGFWVMFFAT